MKKALNLASLLCTLAISATVANLSAQTGENPKPKTSNPPPKKQNPLPPQPPVYNPGPILTPPPQVYYPPSGNAPMGTAPQKTPAQIAAENRMMAKEQVYKELAQLQSDIQFFEIKDVTKPFEVTGSKGFKISFPEFAFVDEDGNPVLGEVKINMTEYTSFSEFAAAGLTTMTTDGEILETGGMINLEAKSGDKNIKLANGKEISITVPNAATDKGFQTFYGSGTDQIKWSTNPQQSNVKTEEQPYDGYTIKMLKPSGFAYGDQLSMSSYKTGESLETYVNAKLKVSETVKKKILKDGIPFVYTIEFNALGKIKNVQAKNRDLTDKSLISPLNNQIISILKDAPAFNMTEGGLMAGKPYDLLFVTAKNYTGTSVNIVPPVSFPESVKNENKVNERPTASNVSEFTMKSSSLQKINCDRFSGYASNDTATFHFDRADAMVYIVLKDMRAMISPNGSNGDYYMTKIPAGTAVRYVAVVYDDQGNVHISTNNSNFGKGPVTFNDNIPFSAMNLRMALEAP